MVMPARVFPHFIVRHPELGFAFFKALFHGPAESTEPDKGAQGCARWSITDIVRIRWLIPQGPLDHQPDSALWQPLLTAGIFGE